MRLVDRIAYINHDIDDAVRAGVLRVEDLPADAIAVLGRDGLRADRPAGARPGRALRGAGDIVQGEEVGGAMLRLRTFMFEHVYLGRPRARARARSSGCCGGCSSWYCDAPGGAARRRRRRPGADRVIDYIAGMTDRFAHRAWSELVPHGFAA